MQSFVRARIGCKCDGLNRVLSRRQMEEIVVVERCDFLDFVVERDLVISM